MQLRGNVTAALWMLTLHTFCIFSGGCFAVHCLYNDTLDVETQDWSRQFCNSIPNFSWRFARNQLAGHSISFSLFSWRQRYRCGRLNYLYRWVALLDDPFIIMYGYKLKKLCPLYSIVVSVIMNWSCRFKVIFFKCEPFRNINLINWYKMETLRTSV